MCQRNQTISATKSPRRSCQPEGVRPRYSERCRSKRTSGECDCDPAWEASVWSTFDKRRSERRSPPNKPRSNGDTNTSASPREDNYEPRLESRSRRPHTPGSRPARAMRGGRSTSRVVAPLSGCLGALGCGFDGGGELDEWDVECAGDLAHGVPAGYGLAELSGDLGLLDACLLAQSLAAARRRAGRVDLQPARPSRLCVLWPYDREVKKAHLGGERTTTGAFLGPIF
jgi:hypothetical protein